MRDNAVIYPPADVRERFELQKVYSPDEPRTFDRAWLEFKSRLWERLESPTGPSRSIVRPRQVARVG